MMVKYIFGSLKVAWILQCSWVQGNRPLARCWEVVATNKYQLLVTNKCEVGDLVIIWRGLLDCPHL